MALGGDRQGAEGGGGGGATLWCPKPERYGALLALRTLKLERGTLLSRVLESIREGCPRSSQGGSIAVATPLPYFSIRRRVFLLDKHQEATVT
jgi:hypothetical protein